jgi:hypothetical protein
MHSYQLAIHADGRAARGQPKDRRFSLAPAKMNHFRDSLGDYFCDVIVVGDDNTDTFTNLRVQRLASQLINGASVIAICAASAIARRSAT